jgi:hypothetical protein
MLLKKSIHTAFMLASVTASQVNMILGTRYLCTVNHRSLCEHLAVKVE